MNVRNVEPEDYFQLPAVVNNWTAHDSVYELVPRLFFEHFKQTSFIVKALNETVGILIGFVSQSEPNIAYIHFVSVNPKYRQQGVGRMLYKHFTEAVTAFGCDTITCITSPLNKGSIAFHQALGFTYEKVENYNVKNEKRIVFTKKMSQLGHKIEQPIS